MNPIAASQRPQVSPAHKGRLRWMTAAILEQPRRPLVVADDVEIPALEVGHVLVKVQASGVCGKQLDEISGRQGNDPYLPHLLGHEGAGLVVDIGPGVTKVKPGDHVVLHWIKGSGINAVPPRFSRRGGRINAGCVTTFSTYTVASENRLTPVPHDVPFDTACLLGCAATTGLGIVFNNAQLLPGQSILVYGIGGVGLNVLQGAMLVNAYPIVAVDVHEHKLEQACEFGATHTFRADQSHVEQALRALTGDRGFDAAVDATGLAPVRELVYRLTSNTGRTILAGVPHHEDRMTIDSFPVHFGRRLIGVHGGDIQPDVDIPRFVGLFQRGQLKLNEQITHHFDLEQVNEAIEVVRQGKAGRCVLVMP